MRTRRLLKNGGKISAEFFWNRSLIYREGQLIKLLWFLAENIDMDDCAIHDFVGYCCKFHSSSLEIEESSSLSLLMIWPISSAVPHNYPTDISFVFVCRNFSDATSEWRLWVNIWMDWGWVEVKMTIVCSSRREERVLWEEFKVSWSLVRNVFVPKAVSTFFGLVFSGSSVP
jgi:hypothetical protein